MKKLFLLFCLMCIYTFSTAQNYNWSKSTGTYTPLSSPIVVSGSTPWTPFQSHTVPIGFNFVFYGQTFTSIWIEGSGFCRFDINYYYLINPYTVQMQDLGTGGPSSLSPLSYELTGTTPNRILKIEWSNCEPVDDPGSIVNFQLWLYETSNTIEVHIGNCNIISPSAAFQGNATDGPVVAIFDYVQSIGKATNGTPPSETGATLSSITTPFDYSMSGVPTNGTIYIFSLPMALEESSDDFVAIYPNPTNDFTGFWGPSDFSFILKDLSGKIVRQGMSNTIMDLTGLPSGVYYLQTMLYGKWHSKKLIKN